MHLSVPKCTHLENPKGAVPPPPGLAQWLGNGCPRAHPHPNVLRLLEVFAPSLPSRPHWVFATVEAETILRAIIYKHNALLRQGDGAAARELVKGLAPESRWKKPWYPLTPPPLLTTAYKIRPRIVFQGLVFVQPYGSRTRRGAA